VTISMPFLCCVFVCVCVWHQVILRLLLVDGKSHDFPFPATATSAEVADHVFQNWPSDWNGDVQKPDRPEVLRLIYRGRFLRPTTTLSCESLLVCSIAIQRVT